MEARAGRDLSLNIVGADLPIDRLRRSEQTATMDIFVRATDQPCIARAHRRAVAARYRTRGLLTPLERARPVPPTTPA